MSTVCYNNFRCKPTIQIGQSHAHIQTHSITLARIRIVYPLEINTHTHYGLTDK